jgi:hypothetical protein
VDQGRKIKEGKISTHIFSTAGKPPPKRTTTNINVVTGRRMANPIGFNSGYLPTNMQLADGIN